MAKSPITIPPNPLVFTNHEGGVHVADTLDMVRAVIGYVRTSAHYFVDQSPMSEAVEGMQLMLRCCDEALECLSAVEAKNAKAVPHA